MALLMVVLYTQERIVYSARHPSNSCRDSDTFSWKSSADLLEMPNVNSYDGGTEVASASAWMTEEDRDGWKQDM
ncbi:hypothetical protein EYF80_005908 [Liparis tanakae]|uniref:Uncharacterized protein n=1 Tax=Liparis tanakae TaxID=230148 RepID=A0A4Z2J2L7_9TELE|nr:hypothetical protein EYF80_005908 [Liparis tanakae]